MSKEAFVELHTERLSLKRLQNSDWREISYLRSDPIINQYVKRPNANTKKKAIDFIRKVDTGIKNQDIYYWKIVKKKENEMIGSICLWNFSEDNRTAEVGYDLKPENHKMGIMDESLKSIIQFGFRRLMLKSIEAYTHRDNESSTNLLERNGFKRVRDRIDENNVNNVIYVLEKVI